MKGCTEEEYEQMVATGTVEEGMQTVSSCLSKKPVSLTKTK